MTKRSRELDGAVHDDSGEPVFRATRHELLQLLRFWIRRVMDEDFREFDGQSCSTDRAEAHQKIADLRGIVEGDGFLEAFCDAESEFGSRQDYHTYLEFLLDTKTAVDPDLTNDVRLPSEGDPTMALNGRLSEDCDLLVMPFKSGRVSFGFVDEIAGRGGVIIPQYDVSREEALELVRYWGKEILEIDYGYFEYPQTGSSEIRLSTFAARRINRIEAIVGPEPVDAAIEEARAAFSVGIPHPLWQMFLGGEEPPRRPDGSIRWPR